MTLAKACSVSAHGSMPNMSRLSHYVFRIYRLVARLWPALSADRRHDT